MITCEECKLHYEIIYNNDMMGVDMEFCPRCGCRDLIEDEEEIDGVF